MYIFLSVLILLVAVLLGLVVLVQNPKGGGLAANFAGSTSQFMGVRQTADFLEKASWYLAIALLVLSLASTTIVPRTFVGEEQLDTELLDEINNLPHNTPAGYELPPESGDEGGE